MSKFSKESVGRTFTILSGKFEIDYAITDESFDHEFGTERQYGYEVMKVKYYIDEISEYVEIGESKDLNRLVDKIVKDNL